MRESHTAVLARNERWQGAVRTEPYEAAWASEAIVFLRVLEPVTLPDDLWLRVQISPDGMRWCDHGARVPLRGDPETPTHVSVERFGAWLRLAGELPEGVSAKVIAYLALKE